MLFKESFPTLQELKENGVAQLNMTNEALTGLSELLSAQTFTKFDLADKPAQADAQGLYTEGTSFVEGEPLDCNGIIRALSDFFLNNVSRMLGIPLGSMSVSVMVSKCTKGYSVGWHTDHSSDPNSDFTEILAIPIYVTEGTAPLDGMLEFCKTSTLGGEPLITRRIRSKSGVAAVISSLDDNFSHRAGPVTQGVRYMIRFEIIKRN